MVDEVSEKLARILDRTGDYRILRRVPPPTRSTMTDADRAAAGLAVGVVLDTETTGLGVGDEIIELGMLRFAFDPNTLTIAHVVSGFSALRQPHRPIPPDVVRLTGIGEKDVVGHSIDDEAVRCFVADASIVIAHNSSFDRPVVERAWPWFAELPWACSLTQVDWRAEGFEGRRLGQLLAERRSFHDGHRALNDCVALLHLLQLPLTLGVTGFELMMREAAQVSVRSAPCRTGRRPRCDGPSPSDCLEDLRGGTGAPGAPAVRRRSRAIPPVHRSPGLAHDDAPRARRRRAAARRGARRDGVRARDARVSKSLALQWPALSRPYTVTYAERESPFIKPRNL